MSMVVTWLIQLTVLNQQSPNIVSELAKENLQLQLIQRTVAAFILLCFNMGELSCNVSDGGMGWSRRPGMVLEKILANLRYFLLILAIEQAFLTLQITTGAKFYQTSRLWLEHNQEWSFTVPSKCKQQDFAKLFKAARHNWEQSIGKESKYLVTYLFPRTSKCWGPSCVFETLL